MIYFGDATSYLVPIAILLSMPAVGRRVATSTSESTASGGGYATVLRDGRFLRFLIFGLVITTAGYAQIEVGFTGFSTVVAEVPARVVGWAFAGNTLLIVLAQLFVLRWLEGRSRTRALALVGVIFASSWLILALAGLAGQGHLGGSAGPTLAAIGVVACSVVFAMGETLLSPVMPAITNALATDEVRGRYNALGSMIHGVSGIVGPVVAGPLIGAGRAPVWVVLVVGGSLVASVLALRLRHRLTPAQDGRAVEAPPAPRHAPEAESTRDSAHA
jgi:hypothetical protein